MSVLLIKDWLKIIENCYKNKLESEGFELTIDISWPEFYQFKLRDRMAPFNRTVAKTISKREIQQVDFDFIIMEMVSELSEYREYDQKIGLNKAMDRMNSISFYGVDPLSRYSKTNVLPILKKIIFNGPATIVLWNDGSKTVVKCSDDETWDPYTAVAYAYMKKIFGSNHKFKKMVEKWFPEGTRNKKTEKEDPWKHCRTCIWENKDADQEPCASCDLIDHPVNLKKAIISDKDVDEIKGDFNKRACVDCYYQPVPLNKDPCNVCCRTANHDNFIRREE